MECICGLDKCPVLNPEECPLRLVIQAIAPDLLDLEHSPLGLQLETILRQEGF